MIDCQQLEISKQLKKNLIKKLKETLDLDQVVDIETGTELRVAFIFGV